MRRKGDPVMSIELGLEEMVVNIMCAYALGEILGLGYPTYLSFTLRCMYVCMYVCICVV